MSIDVIGLGALNMDHIYLVDRILEDGEAEVRGYECFPGGSAANTISGLAKLGIRTGFIGATGDDAEGKLLKKDLQKAGVDVSQLKVKPKSKSGQVLCLSDAHGCRALYVLPGSNSLLTVDDISQSYVNQARLLHVSSFVDKRQFRLTVELMEKLESSVKLSFAPGALYSARGFRALKPILSRTHILFLNYDEIRQLTGQEDIHKGAETCLKAGCWTVVVTLGSGTTLESGENAVVYIRSVTQESFIQPAEGPAKVFETTGAGDAFAAGFLYGLLKDKLLADCGRLGDLMARFKMQKPGARQGLPTLRHLSRRYEELYGQPL